MVYDFHTHTFLSDGVLSPIELVRRAVTKGYRAIAITDHAGVATQEPILKVLVKECEIASREFGIPVIPGVELTHLPRRLIHEAARQAKELGADIVVVHGETIVEPVEEGTNMAALECPYVDVLAHPGLVTPEAARLAAERGIFLELSARKGHSFTNGHVAKLGLQARALLLLHSDAHEPQDLLTPTLAAQIARGAGLDDDNATTVLHSNPVQLLRKLGLTS